MLIKSNNLKGKEGEVLRSAFEIGQLPLYDLLLYVFCLSDNVDLVKDEKGDKIVIQNQIMADIAEWTRFALLRRKKWSAAKKRSAKTKMSYTHTVFSLSSPIINNKHHMTLIENFIVKVIYNKVVKVYHTKAVEDKVKKRLQ